MPEWAAREGSGRVRSKSVDQEKGASGADLMRYKFSSRVEFQHHKNRSNNTETTQHHATLIIEGPNDRCIKRRARTELPSARRDVSSATVSRKSHPST